MTNNSIEYNKNYYETNKAKIMLYQKAKIRCDFCNCQISKYNFSKHLKSLKHQKNEQNDNNNALNEQNNVLNEQNNNNND